MMKNFLLKVSALERHEYSISFEAEDLEAALKKGERMYNAGDWGEGVVQETTHSEIEVEAEDD